jgi:hypothetical protein
MTFASLEVSELSIRAFGDSAVATGRTTATLAAPKPGHGRRSLHRRFVRRNSRRLVVASPATNFPARPRATRECRVTISGFTNLRGLGGYTTADGRRVNWELVYRSDQLAQLTDDGFAELARRGITTICDLRRDDERQRAPTRWRGPNRRRFCCGFRCLTRICASQGARARTVNAHPSRNEWAES